MSQTDPAQGDAAGDFGGFEAGRRETAMSQPSHRRVFRGRPTLLDDIRAERYGAKAPVEPHVCPRPHYAYVPPAPAEERNLPMQRAVDRTDPLERNTIDIEIREKGKVVEILRFPVFGRYGADPNDPTWFPNHVDPRTAICGILAPYAAVRCLALGGAW